MKYFIYYYPNKDYARAINCIIRTTPLLDPNEVDKMEVEEL